MDPSKHLQRITEAISELLAFHTRTASPAPIPHQFVGTIIDNTVGLLTAPANSLDGGSRSMRFEEAANWVSLMQSVHRSFFSSVLAAVELGITHLCQVHNIAVTSTQGEKFFGKVTAVQKASSAAGLDFPELAALAKHFSSYRPVFADYLEATLARAALEKTSKKHWRGFFRALSIVRNKTSHSDVSLTDTERNDLRNGGFEVMVDEHGELVLNPRMYAQVVHFTLQFFDELHLALPSKGSR